MKAKAQKAASRAEKASVAARRREEAEAASWKDSVTDRKAGRRQAKEEKEMQRRAKLEAKKALMAAEEKEISGMKAKGKRRKAQLAAGSSPWGNKAAGGKVKQVSMKSLNERNLKLSDEFVRKVLTEFYTKHNPEKIENIDKIIEKFRGKWTKLEEKLRKKFGEDAPNFEQLWKKEKDRQESRRLLQMAGIIQQEDVTVKVNVNHVIREQKQEGVAVAFGIDETLEQMSQIVKGPGKADRNPEKRRKALFKAYEEREMARLREENPKLKRSQLKERIFEAWKKSPENPMNMNK